MKKIKKIEYAKRKDTVYDFETPSHTYILGSGLISHNTQEMYSKAVVSGGTGLMYSSDTVFIIGRQQDKVGTDIQGYHFVINIDKSRFVREKSKLPITVSWEGGVEKWSGLLAIALETGHVIKPKNGWYQATHKPDSTNLREKQTMCKEFWNDIFENTDFKNAVEKRYQIDQPTTEIKITDEL